MLCESVILAAGLGTRMKSAVPKVLHPLGGRPMLAWAVQAAREAVGRPPVIVVGPDSQALRAAVDGEVRFVEQRDRLGTGHAALQAEAALRGRCDLVLVTSADMPLLRPETLREMVRIQSAHAGPLTLLAVNAARSRGFGRVLRGAGGEVVGVVEEAHATSRELALDELNAGAYCFESAWLWERLPKLPLSPKGEYYLTDLVAMAASEGRPAAVVHAGGEDEVIGVNTRVHLAEAEAALRKRINEHWMLEGVTIVDPATTYIAWEAEIGPDTHLLPNTHLWGRTRVGRGCILGPNMIVRDSRVGDGCRLTGSVVEGATLEEDVQVGPFAHLRAGAHLLRGVHIGNFGEVKSSTLGAQVKMGHFSYVGDATVGEGVNIGAGTVTCNFDGERKNPTEIGDEAFIGSDTMLVAPVRVGRRARTGAGAVVTKDVPDDTLAVGMPARAIRRLKPDKG